MAGAIDAHHLGAAHRAGGAGSGAGNERCIEAGQDCLRGICFFIANSIALPTCPDEDQPKIKTLQARVNGEISQAKSGGRFQLQRKSEGLHAPKFAQVLAHEISLCTDDPP